MDDRMTDDPLDPRLSALYVGLGLWALVTLVALLVLGVAAPNMAGIIRVALAATLGAVVRIAYTRWRLRSPL
jgi:hypothetical protein